MQQCFPRRQTVSLCRHASTTRRKFPGKSRPFPRPVKPAYELQRAILDSPLPVPEPIYPSSWSTPHGVDRESSLRYNAALESIQSALKALRSEGATDSHLLSAGFQDGLAVIASLGASDRLGISMLLGLQKLANRFPVEARSASNWAQHQNLLLELASRQPTDNTARSGFLSTVIANWAWQEVKDRSQAGAQHVVDFWRALPLDVHKDGSKFSSRVLPPQFLAAVVAAQAILNPAADLLAVLHELVKRNTVTSRDDFRTLLESNLVYQSAIKSLPAKVTSWINQAELALIWAAKRGGEAGLRDRVKAWGNRKDVDRLKRLWSTLMDGASGNQAWIAIAWHDDGIIDQLLYTEMDESDKDHYSSELARSKAAVPVEENQPHQPLDVRLTPALVASFLLSFFRSGHHSLVDQALVDLQHKTLPMTNELWMALMYGNSFKRDIVGAERVISRMRKAGVEVDAQIQSFLIITHLKADDTAGALHLLQKLIDNAPENSIPTQAYNRIIHNLLKANQLHRANQIMMSMPREGNSALSVVTVNTLLAYYAQPQTLDIEKLSEAFRFLSERGLQPDVTTFNTIIQGLLVAGRREAAERVLTAMQRLQIAPNERTYAPLIQDLVQRADLKQAIRLLDRMEKTGSSNEFVYTIVIKGFCELPPLKASNNDFDDQVLPPNMAEAQTIVDRMKKRAIPLNSITYNALISGHISTGTRAGIARAIRVFEEAIDEGKRKGIGIQKNTWFILLSALVHWRDVKQVKKVLQEMDDQGFKPSGSLLKLVEEARRL